MKNQYFGDINDYRKYGLLRAMLGQSVTTTICWMLTPDGGSSDGRQLAYLHEPERWRRFDPPLYDCLQRMIFDASLRRRSRNLRGFQRRGILRGAGFYDAILGDDQRDRQQYFEKLWRKAQGTDLVFYDPDNGLEIKSVPRGRKRSSKYLYWDEVVESAGRGHSVLIYQHFPRGLSARVQA